MTLQEFRFFISKSGWTFAKSMPQWPHSYTLRKNAITDIVFVEAVKYIREYGYARKFKGRDHVYIDVDGFSYWTMGAPLDKTILINRAIADNDSGIHSSTQHPERIRDFYKRWHEPGLMMIPRDSRFISSHPYWVLEHEPADGIVGVIGAISNQRYWSLIGLLVRSSSRGNGFGASLVKTVIDNAVASGELRTVSPDYFSRFGFRDTGKRFKAETFQKICRIAGVRTEESPSRFMGLTDTSKYKWVTWGKTIDKKAEQYTLYPIYDWSYSDVWKAIHDNGWRYNTIYDAMYQYGIPVPMMRVSNVHHETAVHSLFFMQEVEPETYNRLVARIKGIDMAAKMGVDDYFVRELPFMFESWREYRDYLLEHLIDNPDWRARFRKVFAKHDRDIGEKMGKKKYLEHIQAILTNDWEGVKLGNFYRRPNTFEARNAVKLEALNEKAG